LKFVRAALSALVILGVIGDSRVRAISVKPVSPERALADADLIVVATVTEKSTRWTNERRAMITTDYRFRVDRLVYDPVDLFSTVGAGDSCELSFAGGTVGDESVWIPGIPRFDLNEQVILLIDREDLRAISPLVGVHAGLYRVAAGPRGPAVLGGSSGSMITRSFFSSVEDRRNGFTVDEFVAELERAIPLTERMRSVWARESSGIPKAVRHLAFRGDQIPTASPASSGRWTPGAFEPPRRDLAAPRALPRPPSRAIERETSYEQSRFSSDASRYEFLWIRPTAPSVFNIPPSYYTGQAWGLNFEYCLSDWNRYADSLYFRFTESDNEFGHQGRNDFAFTTPLEFLRAYGCAIGGNTLAIAVMYNSAGNGIEVGQIIREADVILNLDQNWTLDWETGYNNLNIWFFRSTVIHELGHTFGREHQFTEQDKLGVFVQWNSVMNYPPAGALDNEFWLPFGDDAASIRAAYPGLAAPITDLGINLFRTLETGSTPVPVSWSAFPSNVNAGGGFTVSNYVVENLGMTSVGPMVDWYLTPNRHDSFGARYCSSSTFPELDADSHITATSTVSVPESIPTGSYYVAAAVNSDDYNFNQVAWSNACINVAGPACPAGMPEWLDPPDLVVDARQPHEVDDASVLQGIKVFSAKAPVGAEESCWALDESPGPPRNSIESVTFDGSFEGAGRYSITLAEPLTPNVATSVSYSGDATRAAGTFTSRPGDSNAGGTADAGDISAMISCCLDASCAPFGAFVCDIDHSSSVSGADLLRLVDVLNAAGEFTSE